MGFIQTLSYGVYGAYALQLIKRPVFFTGLLFFTVLIPFRFGAMDCVFSVLVAYKIIGHFPPFFSQSSVFIGTLNTPPDRTFPVKR